MSKITIFSDGSSRGNPGPGGFGAIVVCNSDKEKTVKEFGGREEHTTNNRMELRGVIEAFEYLKQRKIEGEVMVYSDSSYVVKGSTSWVYGWQSGGWKTKDGKDVANKDFWQRLVLAVRDFDIKWELLLGHAGIAGNERCDEIATSFALGKDVNLFEGPMSAYEVPLVSMKTDTRKLEIRQTRKTSAGKAYSYVSLVDGEIKIHKTWAECEERVKGKPNVRFKKALSREDEENIMIEFSRGNKK